MPCTMTATNHDGHSNENVKKTIGVLLRNRQIHDIVGQISPSYVFGHHGRGHHGHCLWPLLSNPISDGLLDVITTGTVRVVLFSVVSVFLCLSVNANS